MHSSPPLLPPLLLLLLLSSFVDRAAPNTIVTGTVICDQCRDGHRGLFDYPLSGAKVAMACGGTDGRATEYGAEATTNFFGAYWFRFEGTPDLSQCLARVVPGLPSGRCGAAAGPAGGLYLLFRFFGSQLYTVAPLLSQPEQPAGYCPRPSSPAPPVALTPPTRLPPHGSPPFVGSRPPVAPPPPVVGWRSPPLPFLRASACPYDKWMMPEYRCHWKFVGPDTKVAVAFGLVAAHHYGTDMTLWEGLHGRGELYRTLLREATAALLNSYNSLGFFYPTLVVMHHTNMALIGPPQLALAVALRFRWANSGAPGYGGATCNFRPCG